MSDDTAPNTPLPADINTSTPTPTTTDQQSGDTKQPRRQQMLSNLEKRQKDCPGEQTQACPVEEIGKRGDA